MHERTDRVCLCLQLSTTSLVDSQATSEVTELNHTSVLRYYFAGTGVQCSLLKHRLCLRGVLAVLPSYLM